MSKEMKILMINKFLHKVGGTETYIFRLGKQLEMQGHEVQFFGMYHPENTVGNNAKQYTENMDFHSGLSLRTVSYGIKTIYSLEAKRKLTKVLDDFIPDVCHINLFNFQLTPSIIVAIKTWNRRREKQGKSTCRIIYTAHEYQLLCPDHMLWNPSTEKICEKCLSGKFRHCIAGKCIHGSKMKSIVGALEAYYWNYRGIYRYFDKIICCSDFLKEKMDKNPVFRKKTVAIHNFIDVSGVGAKEDIGDYVLFFGRMEKAKGFDLLTEACKQLPEIPFVFAGDGPGKEKLKGIENAKYIGFKSVNELREVIRQARFSICPSEWYENCPFSVLESQALGTPVIGAGIGGIPELIDSDTGALFKAGDCNDLIREIKRLWNDTELIRKMSLGCIEKKQESLETYTAKLLEIYTQP